MAQKSETISPGQIGLIGVAAAGAIAAFALPRLFFMSGKGAAVAIKSLGGMTYRDSPTVPGKRPNADPAAGRPA